MKTLLRLALLVVSLTPLAARAEPAPVPGWMLAGSDKPHFRIGLDRGAVHGGRASAKLEASGTPDGFGTLMQWFNAEDYRGKRVRFSGFVKTDAVSGWAGLWMRVDRRGSLSAFDNMQERAIHGSTGWTRYEVVLDVAPDARGIALGLLQDGSGASWLDDARLEVVDRSVPVTAVDHRPRALVDPGFESGPDRFPVDTGVAWFVSGAARKAFTASTDRTAPHGGQASVRLTRTGTAEGYGSLMQAIRADDYRGKRVKLTAWTRGEAIDGRGELWARVQAADSPSDGPGLESNQCRLAGTYGWKACELVLDVPEAADAFEVGVGLGGGGTVWLDDVSLQVVPASTPLTPRDGAGRTPLNLDFEQEPQK